MPWRGPERPGEFPTLGYLVGEWIEAHVVIPDGVHQGEPFKLTNEQLRFLLHAYRLHPEAVYDEERPSAPFVYRGAMLMRPQKWGKGPFAGADALAQAFGPVLFDGWDANGEPVGRPWATPWIQIVATSEEQTDNTWLALYSEATLGPIADFPDIDIGVEDLTLPGGGKIEPRTASGRARLGARITRAYFDESHLMLESNGGVLLATTMKRNLAGMGGRWMETTNAYDPSQNSIAQRTHESKAPDVYIDYRPASRRPNLQDEAEALKLLEEVYGDSYWVDVERVLADARDPATCPTTADAVRYFFNLLEVGVSAAVDAARWDACAHPDEQLAPKTAIALGFDGSRSHDWTSIVASRVSDGRWFHMRSWDPSTYPDGRVPRDQVDQEMIDIFNAYDVRFLFGDPYRWQEYFELWAARWPERVVEFPTNADKRMDDAITRFLEVFKGPFTHNGDPILSRHAKDAALQRGARKKPRPEENQSVVQHYLKVIKKRETVEIDAFIAGILAEVARGQAIEAGGLKPPPAPLVAWGKGR